MRLWFLTGAALAGFALPACADGGEEAFVEANLRAIFYHELGHAVIDLMELPVLGQEEDAADVLSVLMIDWLFEPGAAEAIAYDSAFGYLNAPIGEGEEAPAWWDLHGGDEQRYYTHVCLFYGANPDERAPMAEELGLPEERAETCPDEHDLAAASWGAVFDDMTTLAGEPIRFEAGEGEVAGLLNRLVEEEVAEFNSEFTLPAALSAGVAACGEANAFYDPETRIITICRELVPYLSRLYAVHRLQ